MATLRLAPPPRPSAARSPNASPHIAAVDLLPSLHSQAHSRPHPPSLRAPPVSPPPLPSDTLTPPAIARTLPRRPSAPPSRPRPQPRSPRSTPRPSPWHNNRLLDSLNQDSLNLEATGHEPPALAPSFSPRSPPPDQLPRELTLWPEAEPSAAAAARSRSAEPSRPAISRSRTHYTHSGTQPFAPALPGLTVRLFGDAAASPLLNTAYRRLSSQFASSNSHLTRQEEDHNEAEARLLDEEIAFRKSPVFEEPAGPPMPLPANLIEFPRQLVAPRKARPRYAEGPLRASGPSPWTESAPHLRGRSSPDIHYSSPRRSLRAPVDLDLARRTRSRLL